MSRVGIVEGACFENEISKIENSHSELSTFGFLDFIGESSKIESQLGDLLDKIELKKKQGTCKLTILSKTLHLCFPDLILPMDRTFVLGYLIGCYGANALKTKDELNVMMEYHKQMAILYKNHKNEIDALQLPNDCPNKKYPVTKLLDNMIIGLQA